MKETTKALFETLRTATGGPYLEAERALLAAPGAAGELAKVAALATDAVEAFLARVLGQWIESRREDYGQAITYLDRKNEQFQHSPLGAPRWDVCARDLVAYFGAGLSDFLALRLLKEPAWPKWRVMTAHTYLYDVGQPESLPPLVRLVAETTDDGVRQTTLRTLFAMLARARPPAAASAEDAARFEALVAATAAQAGADGRLVGERAMVLHWLRGRFGELPPAAIERVRAAPAAALARWTAKAPLAASLGELW